MTTAQSKKEGEKNEQTDWAEIYTTLLSHTNLTKTDIENSTIVFIDALLGRLGKHIKISMPFLGFGGGVPEQPKQKYKEAEKAPTINEIEAFVRGS